MVMSLKRRVMLSVFFPLGWNVMAGVEAAILDSEVNLRMEAMPSRATTI